MTNAAKEAPQDLFDHPAPSEEFQEHGHTRNLGGWALKTITWAAIAFSAYQLMVAGFSPLSSMVTRALHVGFLLLIAFLLYPVTQGAKPQTRIPWYDWILALSGFGLAFYQWIYEGDLIQRSGDPTMTDLFVGAIVVLLVFEAARRILEEWLWNNTMRIAALRPNESSSRMAGGGDAGAQPKGTNEK